MDLISNLIFLYHCVIASEQLLIEAAQRAVGPLQDYFRQHLEEERGHDRWLAEDLESIGVEVKRTVIPVEAMEMVGTVYYLVMHVDPVALLGYMQVMERGEHPQMKEWEAQYPASLLRTLKYHDEHDRDHRRDLERTIQTLTPNQKALVEQTRGRTLHYFQRAFHR
jgi:hypothetical protein